MTLEPDCNQIYSIELDTLRAVAEFGVKKSSLFQENSKKIIKRSIPMIGEPESAEAASTKHS